MARFERSFKGLMASIVVLYSNACFAGDSEGTLSLILPISTGGPDGVVFIETAPSTHTGKPSCSNDQWALSLANGAGKAIYAMLLSAQSQGASVHIVGTGNCNVWGDRESIAGAYFVP